MLHIRMIHGSFERSMACLCTNDSWLISKWAMNHSYTNERHESFICVRIIHGSFRHIRAIHGCYTYGRFMAHFVTCTNNSCYTHKRHLWMSHVTRINESCEWVMSHLHIDNILFIESHTHTRTHAHTHTYRTLSLSHTHKYTRYLLSCDAACYTYECVVSMSYIIDTPAYRRQATHQVQINMSHIWMRHVTHMNESCHTYEWGMSHIRMSHVTHMNEPCHTYEWVTAHMNESCHTYE